MKKIASLLLLMCAAAVFAGELVIAEKGKKSDYAIVVADNGGNQYLDRFLRIGADTLNKAVRQATGVYLPVVTEKDFKGKHAIYLGPTRALKQTGIDTARFKLWEHTVFAKNGSVYLAGDDRPNTTNKRWPGDYVFHVLGSLKAATVFCENFAGTIFPLPDMSATEPMAKIAVPENYSYRSVPAMRYCNGRGAGVLYDVANNFYPAPWYGNYGGHSHDKAIPASLYKEHPEYFAMLKGKRSAPHATRPQHCISNPEVQKLIYQELLRHADQGYSMVQLNQSDGYRACECSECAKLYGVKSFGEKLWIMHRRMAEQFLKDRPGKKLCVMAYGPTIDTPKTFRELPPNVVVDIAPCNAKTFADWQKMRVPGGFTVYLYNWGFYHLEGFTPMTTAKFLTEQARAFRKGGVLGIYRCGFGELFGLEGPRYFQYGKQLADPRLDAGILLKRYCRAIYGKAAGTMEQFFDLLDRRIALDIDRSDDWNNPALFTGDVPGLHDNMRVLTMRYPEEVLVQLDSLLTKAEKLEPKSWPLELVRLELDYLKVTARAVNAFDRFRRTKSAVDGKAMLESAVARNVFIDKLPLQPRTNRFAVRNGVKLFGYAEKSQLLDNGRLRAPLMGPLAHDVKWMLDNHILPAGRVMKINGPAQLLVQQYFDRENPEVKAKPVSFEVKTSDKNLEVIFHFGNTDQKAVVNDEIHVNIDRGAERYWFTARARNSRSGYYHRVKTNRDNNGRGDEYKMLPGNPGIITAPAPGVEGASAMIAIPWSAMGGRPAAGEKCGFNVSYRARGIGRIWEHNLYQKTWRNLRDEVGTLGF